MTIIDLDTIDVSNLNRQFLFRREQVDEPKIVNLIAKDSFLGFFAVPPTVQKGDVGTAGAAVEANNYNNKSFDEISNFVQISRNGLKKHNTT